MCAVSSRGMPASRAAWSVAMARSCGAGSPRPIDRGIAPRPREETIREPMRRVEAVILVSVCPHGLGVSPWGRSELEDPGRGAPEEALGHVEVPEIGLEVDVQPFDMA